MRFSNFPRSGKPKTQTPTNAHLNALFARVWVDSSFSGHRRTLLPHATNVPFCCHSTHPFAASRHERSAVGRCPPYIGDTRRSRRACMAPRCLWVTAREVASRNFPNMQGQRRGNSWAARPAPHGDNSWDVRVKHISGGKLCISARDGFRFNLPAVPKRRPRRFVIIFLQPRIYIPVRNVHRPHRPLSSLNGIRSAVRDPWPPRCWHETRPV